MNKITQNKTRINLQTLEHVFDSQRLCVSRKVLINVFLRTSQCLSKSRILCPEPWYCLSGKMYCYQAIKYLYLKKLQTQAFTRNTFLKTIMRLRTTFSEKEKKYVFGWWIKCTNKFLIDSVIITIISILLFVICGNF